MVKFKSILKNKAKWDFFLSYYRDKITVFLCSMKMKQTNIILSRPILEWSKDSWKFFCISSNLLSIFLSTAVKTLCLVLSFVKLQSESSTSSFSFWKELSSVKS